MNSHPEAGVLLSLIGGARTADSVALGVADALGGTDVPYLEIAVGQSRLRIWEDDQETFFVSLETLGSSYWSAEIFVSSGADEVVRELVESALDGGLTWQAGGAYVTLLYGPGFRLRLSA